MAALNRQTAIASSVKAHSAKIRSFDELRSLNPLHTVIYGGSFDPPHLGHLRTIERLSRENDCVIVIPVGKNPLKKSGPAAGDADRLEMLTAMTSNFKNVFVSSEEIERAKASGEITRTIDTIRNAQHALPESNLKFVLGGDCLAQLHLWHDFEDIFLQVTPLVILRPGYRLDWQELNDKLGWRVALKLHRGLSDKVADDNVSSSEIRKALTNGDKNVLEHLSKPVAKIILERNLYGQTMIITGESSVPE